MTTIEPGPNRTQRPMSTRPPLNLIRQQCDGELSAEQAAELLRHLQQHPEHEQAAKDMLAFERSLRERVGKAMGQPTAAPWELKNQIRAALRQDSAARPQQADGSHRRRLWLNGFGAPRANIFAIAATLALIAGVVLFGIFGPTINDIPARNTIDLVAEMATVAGHEHDQFATDSELLQRKTAYRTLLKAETELSNSLGAPVHIADLSSLGYEFCGAGPCSLPVDVDSSHFIYRKTSPEGERSPMVSVFVFPNKRKCGENICDGQPCGQWIVAKEPCSKCRHRVLRTTDGNLVYLLVCCADKDMESVAKIVAHSIDSPPAADSPSPG